MYFIVAQPDRKTHWWDSPLAPADYLDRKMLFGIYSALGTLKDQVEIGFKAVDGNRKEIFLFVRFSKYFDIFCFFFRNIFMPLN